MTEKRTLANLFGGMKIQTPQAPIKQTEAPRTAEPARQEQVAKEPDQYLAGIATRTSIFSEAQKQEIMQPAKPAQPSWMAQFSKPAAPKPAQKHDSTPFMELSAEIMKPAAPAPQSPAIPAKQAAPAKPVSPPQPATSNANAWMSLIKKPAAPAAKPTEDKRGILFGTGITKKVAERDANAQTLQEKAIQATLTKQAWAKEADPVKAFEAKIPEPAAMPVPVVQLPPAPINDGITLDPSQQAALNELATEQYGCLIGAAGTGKTTVTKRLVSMLETTTPSIDLNKARVGVKSDAKPEWNVAVAFCAFTGRAVQQMKRALPSRYHPMCQTIHATLGYAPTYEPKLNAETGVWKDTLVFRPTFTETNKLPYKVVVIDEAGMVPINLWNELYAALPEDCRIIMIGDINQLPPVQGRSVLGFAMTYWPTYELTKIHRQAEGNPIIANAHNILNGKMIKPSPGKVDKLDMPASGSETLNKLVATVKALHKAGQFDPVTDAIVVPQNKGMIGQLHINEKLVHYFNPPKYESGVLINRRTVIKTGMQDAIFAVGDKVMLLANDRELGLTNGMVGWVESIVPNGLYNGKFMAHDETIGGDEEPFELDTEDLQNFVDDFKPDEDDDENKRQASHIMSVRFSAETVVPFSTAGAFRKVTHAYACTCHKMQGGEAPTVLILAHSANSKMLSREWLYTALTRARERVILLCNDRGIMSSISNQRIKGRTLEEKTRAFMMLQDQKDVAIPDLPDPRKVEAA